ncbi:MAG: hypothetical protein AAFP17_11770 [Pseudomonadota bacterium]
MEVSTFELLFKAQAPANPDGLPAVDTVLQGYFLAITNLEDEELRFRLEFVAPETADPDRGLAGNTIVFVDVPDVDNQQGVLTNQSSPDPKVFRPSTGFIDIPACATALVAVLPSAFGPVPGDPTPLMSPDFEVRGFVRLSLPALLEFNPPNPLAFVPQSETPVKVLLTPQNRATFISAAGGISDQTQTALPNAGGAAMAEIEPDPGGPVLIFPPFFGAVGDAVPDVLPLIEPLGPEQRSAALQMLLSAIDPAKTDLATFNKELREGGVPLAIEKREVAKAREKAKERA